MKKRHIIEVLYLFRCVILVHVRNTMTDVKYKRLNGYLPIKIPVSSENCKLNANTPYLQVGLTLNPSSKRIK